MTLMDWSWAERVKNLRRRARWTLAQLAARLGVHWRTVAKWERGDSSPTARHQAGIQALERHVELASDPATTGQKPVRRRR